MGDNKLTQTEITIPTNVTNIKENIENNFNIDNSNVTFQIAMAQAPSPLQDTEKILAMSSFSNEYYQLLVTGDDEVFNTHMISFPVERALSQRYVPPEILERCSTLSAEGIAELKTFPALICKENRKMYGITTPDEIGFYGYIKKVQKTSRQVNVIFDTISPVKHALLCDKKNAVYFDLNMDIAITTLNHTAWSVHRTNLFEAFDVAGIDYPKL